MNIIKDITVIKSYHIFSPILEESIFTVPGVKLWAEDRRFLLNSGAVGGARDAGFQFRTGSGGGQRYRRT